MTKPPIEIVEVDLPPLPQAERCPLTVNKLIDQLILLRDEMDWGNCGVVVALPGSDGFTTHRISLCAPPLKYERTGEEVVAIGIEPQPSELAPAPGFKLSDLLDGGKDT